MTSDDRFDVVIIGGGHNGLVAAAYLARAGRTVRVLERLNHVGGAAVSAHAFDGVDARLSRYSYLVSLLPEKIITDHLRLLQNHQVPVEVGVSDTPIPIHFAFPDGMHVEGDLTRERMLHVHGTLIEILVKDVRIDVEAGGSRVIARRFVPGSRDLRL